MAALWSALLIPRSSVDCESAKDRECPLSAALRRDGFVVLRDALPRDVCAAVRDDLEAELGEQDPPGGEDRRLNIPLPSSHSAMSAMARVVATKASFFLDCFGGDGQLRTLGALISLPTAATQEIHCDSDWVPDTLFCTALVALQDVSLEMGPTVLYAGTHTKRFHDARREYTARAGPQVRVVGEDPLRAHPPSAMTLDAGDMVVFDTRVFHQGTENTSLTRRSLLCFSFLAASSDMRNVPGYFFFFGTPEIRSGNYLVRDFTRRLEAADLPVSPSSRAAYWGGVRERRLAAAK